MLRTAVIVGSLFILGCASEAKPTTPAPSQPEQSSAVRERDDVGSEFVTLKANPTGDTIVNIASASTIRLEVRGVELPPGIGARVYIGATLDYLKVIFYASNHAEVETAGCAYYVGTISCYPVENPKSNFLFDVKANLLAIHDELSPGPIPVVLRAVRIGHSDAPLRMAAESATLVGIHR